MVGQIFIYQDGKIVLFYLSPPCIPPALYFPPNPPKALYIITVYIIDYTLTTGYLLHLCVCLLACFSPLQDTSKAMNKSRDFYWKTNWKTKTAGDEIQRQGRWREPDCEAWLRTTTSEAVRQEVRNSRGRVFSLLSQGKFEKKKSVMEKLIVQTFTPLTPPEGKMNWFFSICKSQIKREHIPNMDDIPTFSNRRVKKMHSPCHPSCTNKLFPTIIHASIIRTLTHQHIFPISIR